jgi:hypothetical protein
MSTTELDAVREKVSAAVQAVQSDAASSPVLLAVVRELLAKTDKALKLSGTESARDGVLEAEQAGDSAKAAAEADPGASPATKASVLDAHLAICVLKANPST